MLLPLVRTGSGKMVGPGQTEDRAACEKIPRNEYDPPGRDDRQTLDVQQRRSNSAVPRKRNGHVLTYTNANVVRHVLTSVLVFR